MSNHVENATHEGELAEMRKRIEALEAENARLKDALRLRRDSGHPTDRKGPPPGIYS
jgi:predicted nuclease with TOPRIM domain